jgi:hypothetical protein
MTVQKHSENLEYLNYMGCTIGNYTSRTRDIKSSIAMAKAVSGKKTVLFANKLDLNARKKLVECYIRSIALYGVQVSKFYLDTSEYTSEVPGKC